jgi:hypothetical protein
MFLLLFSEHDVGVLSSFILPPNAKSIVFCFHVIYLYIVYSLKKCVNSCLTFLSWSPEYANESSYNKACKFDIMFSGLAF